MSILIATPMYGGKCDAEYFKSCLALQESFARSGVDYDWLVMTNESLITRGRNVIAREFLKGPLEALMFIDGDIEFQPNDVAKLWNANKPVIGGCYSRKKAGEVPKVWKDGVARVLSEFSEPFVCDRLGTGFLMIRREALLNLQMDVQDYDESGQCWEYFNTPVQEYGCESGGFQGRWMPSEDYYFCDQWKARGGEIWADPTIHLRHWGRMAF